MLFRVPHFGVICQPVHVSRSNTEPVFRSICQPCLGPPCRHAVAPHSDSLRCIAFASLSPHTPALEPCQWVWKPVFLGDFKQVPPPHTGMPGLCWQLTCPLWSRAKCQLPSLCPVSDRSELQDYKSLHFSWKCKRSPKTGAPWDLGASPTARDSPSAISPLG